MKMQVSQLGYNKIIKKLSKLINLKNVYSKFYLFWTLYNFFCCKFHVLSIKRFTF